MAKITFNNPNSSLNVSSSDQNLDKVKILKGDQLRVVIGDAPQSFTVGAPGKDGPTGPTGPEADFRVTKYYYGNIRPTDARTGDKWFHTEAGIELTYVDLKWIQLYPNIKGL